jgi:glutamate-ammonia-ligase adenylyltransferase
MHEESDSAFCQQHITLALQEFPQAQEYPRLEADLVLVLHGADPHISLPVVLPGLVQALLTSVDPPRALNHLLRYLDCLQDPAAFWTACTRYPGALPALITILASSQFLSSLFWRRPRLFFWLLEDALWTSSLPADAVLTQLVAQLQGKEAEAEVAPVLRAFTQQHLLRIGVRDLLGIDDVETTTASLAALADSVLQAGLDACERWLTAMYGTPSYVDDAGREHPCGFCVIGMGKLGGYELNFSSDIDLMYVYTSYQGQTSGIVRDGTLQGQISNHEYCVALARRLTTLVGGNGPEGQAFRVDLRLRPEGTQGQLTLALLAYEAYYARLGQTWEKMALLKARPVAGDMRLGQEFFELIQPFVYQRHLDQEGIRQLREIKTQIDAQMADKDQSHTNVKLGHGGIREIEFLIQLPQLIFGGRRPELQERHSLQALTRLRQAGLMTPEVETTLRQTYCYLRRIEHRLQMEQGAQTHTLPQRPEPQLRLARQLGFTTWEAFYQDYLQRTDAVHALFVEAFHAAAEE